MNAEVPQPGQPVNLSSETLTTMLVARLQEFVQVVDENNGMFVTVPLTSTDVYRRMRAVLMELTQRQSEELRASLVNQVLPMQGLAASRWKLKTSHGVYRFLAPANDSSDATVRRFPVTAIFQKETYPFSLLTCSLMDLSRMFYPVFDTNEKDPMCSPSTSSEPRSSSSSS